MIFFPFELVKIYQQERINEAEHYRQLKHIRAGQSSLPDHLFSEINDFLVDIGRKLKEQFNQILAVFTKVEGILDDWFNHWLIH